VRQTAKRVRQILTGCDFVFWPDLTQPGAATRVAVHLGDLRANGKIGGKR
jgi:hypothetical protein